MQIIDFLTANRRVIMYNKFHLNYVHFSKSVFLTLRIAKKINAEYMETVNNML